MAQVRKLVLHIDDDPDFLKLAAYHLQKEGYEVVSVQDPQKAMDSLLRSGARVVLLDIDMPGKDGLTLLREIKLRDSGIQVTMCTGMVSMQTVLRSTSLGAEKWWESLAEWKAINASIRPLATSSPTVAALSK